MPTKEEIEQQITNQCHDFITAEDIATRIGKSVVTVRKYLLEMKSRIHRFDDAKPWLYLDRPADEEKLLELAALRGRQPEDGTAPILPQGPLSFLSEYQRYTPAEGRKVAEKHGGWIGRKVGGHIGCGSYAHVDMFG